MDATEQEILDELSQDNFEAIAASIIRATIGGVAIVLLWRIFVVALPLVSKFGRRCKRAAVAARAAVQALSTPPTSPPPLARLSEHAGVRESENEPPIFSTPFSVEREVLDLTISRQSTPATPAAAATPASAGRLPLRDQKVSAIKEPQGWDANLLERCRQNEAAISSVEGLQGSTEFREHMRSLGQPFLLDQVREEQELYRRLRLKDPGVFQLALSRKDIMDYDSFSPPRWMLATSYFLNTAATLALLWLCLHLRLTTRTPAPAAAAAAVPAPVAVESGAAWLIWAPLHIWMLLQCRAWGQGHGSVFARALSLYEVVDCKPPYEEHQFVATWWRIALAATIEVIVTAGTFGAAALLSLLLVLLTPQRQTLGQRLVGLYSIREVVRGQVNVPLYYSPPHSPLTSPHSRATATATRVPNQGLSTGGWDGGLATAAASGEQMVASRAVRGGGLATGSPASLAPRALSRGWGLSYSNTPLAAAGGAGPDGAAPGSAGGAAPLGGGSHGIASRLGGKQMQNGSRQGSPAVRLQHEAPASQLRQRGALPLDGVVYVGGRPVTPLPGNMYTQ